MAAQRLFKYARIWLNAAEEDDFDEDSDDGSLTHDADEGFSTAYAKVVTRITRSSVAFQMAAIFAFTQLVARQISLRADTSGGAILITNTPVILPLLQSFGFGFLYLWYLLQDCDDENDW